MTIRAVIWAGVSSRPQVEDKDSIPRQISEGEALCARHGWQVVARLQVPGATRNYVDLADAIEGLDDDLRRLRLDVPNAYRELAKLIIQRQVDVLVCRSRDRIARTDSLIAGIEERLRRIDATVYSMAMPPTGQKAGDFYVSAVERASAQHEIERLRERLRKGMDDRLRRGLMPTGTIPFPYIESTILKGGRVTRVPIPAPERVEAYLWAVQAVLDRTHTSKELGALLTDRFPELGFRPSVITKILKNPMPIGVILRMRQVQEGEQSSLIVYDTLDTPYWPEIELMLKHRADADRLLSERTLRTPRTWMIAVGQHEPVIDPALWLELQHFLDTRSRGRRPPSRNRLWSGLLWCARCGSPMYATGSSDTPGGLYYGTYMCSQRFRERSVCDNPAISERVVTKQMVEYLEELKASVSADAVGLESVYDPQRELDRQRNALVERRKRLLLVYETGRIDLDTYDQRIQELDLEQIRVQNEINALVEKKTRAVKASRSLETLAESQIRSLLQGETSIANRWLRSVLTRVWIDNRLVTGVEL